MKVNIDKDKNGCSIKLDTGDRRAFRKSYVDEFGENIVVDSFSNDIDDFTGQKDFLKKNNIDV